MDATRTRNTTHIRIRSTMSGHWQWELVTGDGHVASESEKFENRQDCEADALKQALPITGLSRRKAAESAVEPSTSRTTVGGWTISRDGMDLWTWKRGATKSEPAASSTRAFLTKPECVADAEKNGYTPPAAPTPKNTPR